MTPRASAALIAALVIVYALTGVRAYVHGDGLWAACCQRPDHVMGADGMMISRAVSRGEVWRLFTAPFLHFNPVHLAVNCAGIAALGGIGEADFGPRRWTTLFLTGAWFGACFGWATGVIRSAGASGGVFALLTATAALTWTEEPGLARLLAGVAVVQLALGPLVPGVDIAAHTAGAAVGVALGLWWRPR